MIDELSELQKFILLLSAADKYKPITGNTWIQKEMFLISKNVKDVEEEANYKSDFYGPFSENLEEEIGELEQEELLARQGSKIVITTEGKVIVKKIKKITNHQILDMVDDFKKLLNDLNSEELLTLIYFNYPETTDESQVKGKVIQNRIKNSISLYKKDKISITKASEISGIAIDKIIKLVK